ncbi:MAG TPA: hypothetical protein PLZ08_00380 [Bacillota bacterium]|jgi:hypothetical protein|nr:hypothetical protein [Bacillota bacterium]HOL08698.1 hypothetical protein [Bacillota bacterium]HPO96399.1 hypothetical protein [Bacillota bacterium]
MIEIDDAGGGCFIGPEVLVIHRLETGEAWFYTIPTNIRERVFYATRILKRAFQELAISKNETIRLCRGEIFDLFEAYLEEQHYQVIREKVSNATDRLAEDKFMSILHSYGFPEYIKLVDRNYQEFYEMVSLWYYLQPKQVTAKLCKIRLRPPLRPKVVARKYPNLVKRLLEESQSATG